VLVNGAAAAAAADDEREKSKEASAAAVLEEPLLVKRTRAALNMLEQLQQTAHTPSTLLPAGALTTDGPAKRQKAEPQEQLQQ
jgi:hypothetical protein